MRHHPAQGLSPPRLSSQSCCSSSHTALVLAAEYDPELSAEVTVVEEEIGHGFRPNPSPCWHPVIHGEGQEPPLPGFDAGTIAATT